MKLDIALIIVSSVSLFGVILFYIVTNLLRNKINELVEIKKQTIRTNNFFINYNYYIYLFYKWNLFW